MHAAHSVVLSAKVARLPARLGAAECRATWLARADDRSGSFATGSSQQQVRPCPLCPGSDQIPQRSEMTRCARYGNGLPALATMSGPEDPSSAPMASTEPTVTTVIALPLLK